MKTITVVATFEARPGKETELKQLLLGLLAPTRKEAGCLNYDLHISPDHPAKFLFHENWTSKELLDAQLSAEAIPALRELAERFKEISWDAPAVSAAIKEIIVKHGLKMPKLAMPLRVMLVGQTHTPSVDAVLALFPRETVLARIAKYL